MFKSIFLSVSKKKKTTTKKLTNESENVLLFYFWGSYTPLVPIFYTLSIAIRQIGSIPSRAVDYVKSRAVVNKERQPTPTDRADNDQSVSAISQLIPLPTQKGGWVVILIAKVSQMSAAVDQSSWVIACQTINGFG